jgi:crossover junction endodeoxyribonuclease RuvC
MRALGIDPGSNATGFALVERDRGRFVLLDHGVIRTQAADPVAARLLEIYEGLSAVMRVHRPEVAVVEQIFAHRSAESAIRLGQARGIALLVVAQAGLTPAEYNPMTVKKTVAGHGGAGKPEVQRLVQRLLGAESVLPADAADAAALAMTWLILGPTQEKLAALAKSQRPGVRS